MFIKKKMKKSILLALIALSLTACSGQDASTKTLEVKTRCIEGVNYYLFREWSGNRGYGYMSPKWKPDGTLSTCN